MEKLYNDLKKEGISVWLDKWEIKVGDSIVQKVQEGIKKNDYLALILSKNSVNSEWVKREFSAALMLELQGKSILILPILIEDCKIPPLIIDRKYADFRINYAEGFRDLLNTIEAREKLRQFQSELDKLPPEDQIELINTLREELKHLKREKRIMELEQMPLPIVVLEKMVGKEESRTFDNWFEDTRTLEELPPELKEVEIKNVSPQELYMNYQSPGWKVLKRDTKMVWDKGNESFKFGREEGTITIGVYKELLKLYDEQFDYNWLKWKKEYDLNEEEWADVGGRIREMMEMGCIPMEIDNFIVEYILSKTPEGRERLESIYQQWKPITLEELKRYHKRAIEDRKERS